MRAARGFSITELSVALAFFAIFAAGVTALLGSAVTSRVTVVQEADLIVALSDLADRVAAQPYAVLVADTFTVPEPCTPGIDVGSTATSCVTVRQTTYPVTWTLTPVAATATEVAVVTVQGTVTVDRGVQRSVERTVPAPIDGYTSGQAVIGVTALDAPTSLTGQTVYLLDAAEVVVASAAFTSAGTSQLSVDPSLCPSPAPCAVSVSGTGWGQPASDGTVLTGPSARGNIVTLPNTFTAATVGVGQQAELRMSLLARNASGQVAAASDTGSVCLWAQIDDDAGQHIVPVCNGDDPAAITLTDYPTGANATARMALTQNATVELSVDHPDGTCPRITDSASPGVCTSWTWGTPATQWTTAGSDPFGTPISLTTDLTGVAVLWQGANARPAAGYDGEPVWAFPRDPAAITPSGCAATGTCTPVTTPPEQASCPGQQCLSAATPVPALTWDGSVAWTIPDSNAVTTTLRTSGDDTVTLSVVDLPATGTVAVIEEGTPRVLGVDDTIATGVSPTATMRYTPSAGSTTESIVLRVATGSATRDVRLYLVTDTATLAHAFAVTGQPHQNVDAARSVLLLTLDTLAAPVSGTVSLTYGASVAGPASTVSAASGWDAVSITASASGVRTFTTDAGVLATSVVHELYATAIPSSLSVSAPVSAAIGLIPVTVTALDGSGDPLADVHVTFTASAAGADPQVTWSAAQCVTSAAGSCTVSLTTTDVGALTVRAVSAPLADATTVTVTP